MIAQLFKLSLTVILNSDYFNLGPPANFCSGKTDGFYSSPADQSKYFYCIKGKSTGCQQCPASSIYQAECQRCLAVGVRK